MLKDSATQLTGNDRFEGLGIDIINELSLMLGFKYEFQLQEDKNYGGIDKKTGEWTGMIRKLQDDVSSICTGSFTRFSTHLVLIQQAHLAICDLTITSVREKGADFTMPFMNLGK